MLKSQNLFQNTFNNILLRAIFFFIMIATSDGYLFNTQFTILVSLSSSFQTIIMEGPNVIRTFSFIIIFSLLRDEFLLRLESDIFFAVLSFYKDENKEKFICCRPLRRWREYLLKTKVEFHKKKRNFFSAYFCLNIDFYYVTLCGLNSVIFTSIRYE